MLNKIMFLSLSFFTAQIFAMNTTTDLKPWVKAATQIRVRTVVKYGINVSIDDNSTVLDVKNKLNDLEGIPAAQQVISPLITNWWTLGLFDKPGNKLDDSQNIKQIMNILNTDRFLLYIYLRNQPNNQ